MTTPNLGRCVFTYDYVWVNDGQYHSSNDEGRAIDQAGQAAIKARVFREVYDSTAILIERLPCEENHLESCTHLRVTFWQKD